MRRNRVPHSSSCGHVRALAKGARSLRGAAIDLRRLPKTVPKTAPKTVPVAAPRPAGSFEDDTPIAAPAATAANFAPPRAVSART